MVFVSICINTVYADDVKLCGESACGSNEVCSYDKEYGEYCACIKGTTLVENACVADECVKNKCPENSFCTAEFGYAECRCKDGFFLDKFRGKETCVSKDVKNYNEIMLLNEVECTQKGICDFRLDLQYPENSIDIDELNKQNITIRTFEEDYEGELFSGSLDKCLKEGFCKDISANTIAFSSIFPVAGKKEITVDYYGLNTKSATHEALPFSVEKVALPCDLVTCTYGTYCVNRDTEAFCKNDNDKDKDSLAYLMNQSLPTDDGITMLRGVVASPEEQFFYHLSESAPGTSSCQAAPSMLGTFCGEWFFAFLGQPRGITIPDANTTGITRTTSASNFDYMLSSVTLYVDITHTYIGDIVIKLISPNGTEITVRDHEGGSADDLSLAVNLTDFNGENPEGTWTLKVIDEWGGDEGRLTEWGIKLNSNGYKRINDFSANKRHGSYNGSSYPTGVISLAKGFDGSNDRITSYYEIPESFTVTGWIYPTSVSGTKDIVHARKWTETYTPRTRVYLYNGKIKVDMNNAVWLQSNASIPANTWTHIAVSYDRINDTQTKARLYINNEFDSEILGTTVIESPYAFWTFGAYMNGNYTFTYHFAGNMDEFRVYDSVLSRYQRDLVYDYGCSSGYYRRSNKSCYNTDSCGDGRWTGSEECEDQNTTGCDSNCEVVDGYYLDTCFNSCEDVYFTTYTNCGDNYIAGNEECDDGNHVVETCPTYNQSCTVCGETCDEVDGIVEECGDGIVQTSYEECDTVSNCTNCACDSGYYSVENMMVGGLYGCVSVCEGVDCGTTGTCNNSTGQPVCQCGYGYVARNNYCVEGWFEDLNMAAAVVELLQSKGYAVEEELDIDPSYMFDDIEYLNLSGKNIQSIAGIHLFPALKDLDLSYNDITDLYPLELRHVILPETLISLNISNNPISETSSLGTLNLTALNISNTPIYDYSSIKNMSMLKYITVNDENFSSTTFVKPDATSTPDWIESISGSDCTELNIAVEFVGGTIRYKTDPNATCSGHGSCINGFCDCDTDYINVNGSCLKEANCDTGYHIEDNYCVSDTKSVACDLPKNTELYDFENNPPAYIWNSSSQTYDPPSGMNMTPCHYNNQSCNTTSICKYECETGFNPNEDYECEAVAYREMDKAKYTILRFPSISRQDLALETIPGLPLFTPSLDLRFWYEKEKNEENNELENILNGGWYLNFPRVEFRNTVFTSIYGSQVSFGWLKDKVYVYMPWGREEYTIHAQETCFLRSDPNNSVDCSLADYDDWKEITFFPEPGQGIFSYITVKTTVGAYNLSLNGANVRQHFINDSKNYDDWTVKRFGDDGSVTEFKRSKERPASLYYMDYIPATEHRTRDNKVTTFNYTWREVHDNTTYQRYSHWALQKIEIVDPADRMYIIYTPSDEWSGLVGEPDTIKTYKPIDENVRIYTALADSNKEMVDGTDRLRSEYIPGNSPESIDVRIYKDDFVLYRTDEYYWDDDEFVLKSEDNNGIIIGETRWDIQTSGNIGYIEKRKISNSPSEWIEKRIYAGEYYSDGPSNTKKFFSTDYPVDRSTVYSLIDSAGVRHTTRRVDESFSNWLQLRERSVCATSSSSSEDCDSNNISTEKFGYDVNGSLIYKKDFSGQSFFNRYNIDYIGPAEYISHYEKGNYADKAQIRKAGKVYCSADYSREYDSSIETNYLAYANGQPTNLQFWCNNGTNRRSTQYSYEKENPLITTLDQVWDLTEVTYPDGTGKSFAVDHAIGKVEESITTGTTQAVTGTCYDYNSNGILLSQGLKDGSACDYKKGFTLDSTNGLLMVSDYLYNESGSPVLRNYYFYDKLGRKVAETNSADVTTLFYYDALDRVVETAFGCRGIRPGHTSLYEPKNKGETVTGEFDYGRYNCEYSRFYEYDKMNNLKTVWFSEKYKVTSTPSVEYNASNEKIRIAQNTSYNLVGWPIKNCQEDTDQEITKCILAEHDIFGNIVKKTEANNTDLSSATISTERDIDYDYLDRPTRVDNDGLTVQEYEYSYDPIPSTNFYGYKKIWNKYGKLLYIKHDVWGRVASVVDPFNSVTSYTYDDTNHRDIPLSRITTDSSSLEFKNISWTYDDLGRKLTEVNKQFVPGDTTIVNHETEWAYDSLGNIDTIEYDGERKVDYDYDSLNRIEYVAKEKDAGSGYETVSILTNYYNTDGRLFKKDMYSNGKTVTEEYEFDNLGRVEKSCKRNNINGSSDERCSYRMYNSGGKVIWEADEEVDGSEDDSLIISGVDYFGDIDLGNEKYNIYNDFGDIEKEIYVMTSTGKGGDSADTNSWLDDGLITNEYYYDSFGRLVYRMNDRGGEDGHNMGGITYYSYYSSNVTGHNRKNRVESIEIYPALNDGDLNYEDTDSTEQKYSFEYDAYGDKESTEFFEADSNGTYSSVEKTTLGRDVFGRIETRSTDGAINPVSQSFTYNPRNLLATATEGDITVTRLYDSYDNPYHETISTDPSVTTDDKVVINKRTSVDKVETTYPDTKVMEKYYTGTHLDEIKYNGNTVATFTRTGSVLTGISKGANINETLNYNEWNRLESHTVNNGTEDIYDMDYNYTKAWHLAEKVNVKNSSKTDKYSYDSYYRLKQVDYDVVGTPVRTDTFTLDGVHNIEQSTENSVTYDWGVDKLNRLREKEISGVAEVTYNYDEKNNMIYEDQADGRDYKYVYDDLNRLIEIKRYNSSTSEWWKYLEFTYDAFNRRIKKTQYGTDSNRDYEYLYSYDGWNIVAIYKTIYGGLWPLTYHKNIIDSGMDQHVAIEVSEGFPTLISTLYYFITDERGSVVALTDSSGNILERYRYRVYGEFEVLDNSFNPKDCSQVTCYVKNKHNFLWGGSLHEPETFSYDSNGDAIPDSGLYWMRNRYYHKGMHRFINQDPIGIWGDANNLGNGFAYVAGMVVEASDPLGLKVVPANNFIGCTSDGSIDSAADVLVMFSESAMSTLGDTGLLPQPDGRADLFRALFDLYVEMGGKIFEFFKDLSDWANRMERKELSKAKTEAEKVKIREKWEKFREEARKAEEEAKKKEEEKKKKEAKEKKNKKKKEEEKDSSDDGWGSKKKDKEKKGYPANPDDPFNIAQTIFLNNILRKMIVDRTENRNPLGDMGPIIEVDSDYFEKVFIFNPYYKGKDPMEDVIWKIKNDNGTWGFIRNPFAPGAEYGYDATTYEKFQYEGFFQPEVDPWVQ